MRLYTPEEIEILMMVVGSDDPVGTALQLQRRWRHILLMAEAAQQGEPLESTMPLILRHCEEYIVRAQGILAVLEEWLSGADRSTANPPA